MKKFKQILLVGIVLCMLFSLAACGSSEINEKDATALVQGNIDEIYLGKTSKAYLELVGSTEEEAMQAYLNGIEVEAEYFANYWGIVYADYNESYHDLDESLKNEIIDLYKEIYSHSKYEVQPAVKQKDGSFTVEVILYPIDIMEQANNLYLSNEYAPLNAFWNKHVDTDFNAISDEEYTDYTHEYGQIIVQMIRELLPNLDYTEPQTIVLHIQKYNDTTHINDDDWANLDSYMIYYP